MNSSSSVIGLRFDASHRGTGNVKPHANHEESKHQPQTGDRQAVRNQSSQKRAQEETARDEDGGLPIDLSVPRILQHRPDTDWRQQNHQTRARGPGQRKTQS